VATAIFTPGMGIGAPHLEVRFQSTDTFSDPTATAGTLVTAVCFYH
jgi:hypothetical protein